MTDDIENLVASISLNKVLVAILEEYKELSVPTLRFLESSNTDKELVIDYDESGPTFKFSLKEKEINNEE